MTINFSSATAEKCTTGCNLSFDFKETNLTVQNSKDFLAFGVDPVMTPPVVYNNKKYTPVLGYVIYYASSSKPPFSYDNVAVKALFALFLQSGGNQLSMVIPIVESSTNQTSSSVMLTKVLEDSVSKAPNPNEDAKLAISDFSFQSIFPTNSPFFVINDNSSTSIFFKNQISIGKTVLDKLKKIIQPTAPFMLTQSNKVYYNESGAGSNALIKDEEIYIDCQPVNSSKETIEYVTKNPFKNDLSTMLNDPTTYLILQMILSSIVFLVIYFVLSKGFKFMTLGKMPQIIPTKPNTSTN
jgi:hypothetical protein